MATEAELWLRIAYSGSGNCLLGRLRLTPRVADGVKAYEYAGEATLGRLLAGSLSTATMVTPAGSARLWRMEFQGLVGVR
jgi:hypothetical protein